VGGRAIRQAVMRVNAEQASKTEIVDADPPLPWGRLQRTGKSRQVHPFGPPG
jgi:hypothetical protein